MTKPDNPHQLFSREVLMAVLSAMKDLDTPLRRRPSYGQLTREEIKTLVDRLPAKDLLVLEHGRKSGPRPGSLFYEKWQEKEQQMSASV